MLFSGGSSSKPKKEDKKEKKSDRDDKFTIQETVFIRWGNSLLANEPLREFRDLAELKYMFTVAGIITNTTLNQSGSKSDDSASLLSTLGETKTNPQDLAEGQQKAVLAVWWALVQTFWKHYAPDELQDEKVSEAMRKWCVESTKDNEDVHVHDFTSSWRDGYAFNLLLHSFDKKMVNLKKMYACSANERLEHAFSIAEKRYRVPRLLHVKDLHSENLDTRSVVTYLMVLYLSLIGKSSLAQSQISDPSEASQPPQTPTSPAPRLSMADLVLKMVQNQAPPSPGMISTTSTSASATTSSGTATQPETPPSPQIITAEQLQALQMGGAVPPSPVNTSNPRLSPPTTPQTPSVSSSVTERERPEKRKQHSVDHPETEVRSRKSSSSSQKSGKSKRARKEEMTREFENCLEQVLAWLLEAEDELRSLPQTTSDELNNVRAQFSDFEQFMSSLTDSQDTVGRVLHRGQLLSTKAETDEEKEAIQGQIQVVNERWEELRHLAMDRQNSLQARLNQLQLREIATIRAWLSTVENEIEEAGPIAATKEEVLEQIEGHSALQSRIDAFQDTVNSISTFVAVVDDDRTEDSVGALESSLQSVGKRWQAICEWAELRAQQLDGLADLIEQTEQVYETLNQWLKHREHELLGLKSAHHLDRPEEVADQVLKLQQAEAALESEHQLFVRLSQLSCELVARLDVSNGGTANDIRRRLDTVTQRWDNLVSRIEEHSRTLVRSGKADLKQLQQKEKSHSPLSIEETLRAERIVRPEPHTTTVQMGTMDASADTLTTDTETEEANNIVIDRFVRHVVKLTQEMTPLQQWTETFDISKKPDQVRKMISVCQEKLGEIKEQEAKVNRLQLELEHIHLNGSFNAKQLKVANDAFDQFAKGWARIVTKISEAMNMLTGRGSGESDEAQVARGIEKWIQEVEKVLNDLATVSPQERRKRTDKLKQQLKMQTSNLQFVEKDVLKKAILKKGLDITAKRIATLEASTEPKLPDSEETASLQQIEAVECQQPSTSQTPEQDAIGELDGVWSSVGDVEALEKDFARSQKIVQAARRGSDTDLVERAETRKAEMEERRRSTLSAVEKMKIAEKTLDLVVSMVESATHSDAEPPAVLTQLQQARTLLVQRESERKEAERSAEKMLALDDNVPDEVVSTTRERVKLIVQRWKELETSVEDHINCARKEHRRAIQKAISDEERLVEQINKTLDRSLQARDAEECSENLDQLESLLEQTSARDSLDCAVQAMDESFVRESYAKLAAARDVAESKARHRVIGLQKALEEAERFEKRMAELEAWSQQTSAVLSARKAADIAALDVPEEYKELSRQFSNWTSILDELEIWMAEGERRDNERVHEQMSHAKTLFAELRQKFSEFKQPKAFEEKLQRTAADLSDIENALDDLTGIDGASCDDGCGEATRLVKKLKVMDEDMKALENAKEQLLQDGLLDREQMSDVAERVMFAQKKIRELGLRTEGAVERLEDCAQIHAKLEEKAQEVEAFLNGMEKQLEKFAAEDKSNEENQVEELIVEWNRNEAEIKELEDLERALRERAVRVNDNLYSMPRRRADVLKQRLDQWNAVLREMDDDEESLLLEVDALHRNLLSGLEGLDEKPKEQIADKLALLRNDRERLSSRARRLANRNPRLARDSPVKEVTKRWKELESLLLRGSEPRLVETVELGEQQSFQKQMDELEAKFKAAAENLDFEKMPVASTEEWRDRVQTVEAFMVTSRPSLDTVLARGKKAAEEGPNELDMHKDIQRLDDIVDVVDTLEDELETQKSLLVPALVQTESLQHDISGMEKVLNEMLNRNLTDPTVAKNTRRELGDRDMELSSLTSRAAQLHATLPGASKSTRDVTCSTLAATLVRLEDALRDAASPDRTSASSALALAMEAYGTTDANTTAEEEDELVDKIVDVESKEIETEPNTASLTSEKDEVDELTESVRKDPIQQVFLAVEKMEEELAEDAEFPLDGVHNAENRYRALLSVVCQCLAKVEESAMTLDMLQTETTRERLHHIGKDVEDRRKRIPQLEEELAALEKTILEAEKSLSTVESMHRELKDREATPPVDQWENVQIRMEQALQASEPVVMEAVRRLGLALPRLREDGERAKSLRNRARSVEDHFRDASREIATSRTRLDSRVVDQDQLNHGIDNLIFWCDESCADLTTDVNELDEEAVEGALKAVDRKLEEISSKRSTLHGLEAAKERLLCQETCPNEVKHEMRRAVSEAVKRVADLRTDLADRRNTLLDSKKKSEKFWKGVRDLKERAITLDRRVAAVANAVIFDPSPDHIQACRSDAGTMRKEAETVKETVRENGKILGENAEKELHDTLALVDSASASALSLRDATRDSTTSHATSQATTVLETEDRHDAHSVPSVVSSVLTDGFDEEDEVEEPVAVARLSHSMSTRSESEDRTHPALTPREENAWAALTQARHWLAEMERDAALTVDLIGHQAARDQAVQVQAIRDQLRQKVVEVQGVQDAMPTEIIREKTQTLLDEMDRVQRQCEKRRATLARIADDSRAFENARTEMSLWMERSEQAIGERRPETASDDMLKDELDAVALVLASLDDKREAMGQLNKKGNELLDNYPKDDAHSLSHALSKINMRWTKFNDTLRIRRAVLEASMRSRRDFHSALAEFEEWLDEEREKVESLETQTSNKQAIKDTAKRREWAQTEKTLHAELDAHESVRKAVDDMARNILADMDSGSDKKILQARIDEVNSLWKNIELVNKEIRDRLETAEQEWEKLTHQLSSLILWIEEKTKETFGQQPVKGSLSAVMSQTAWVNTTEREMEQKAQSVRDTIASAHSFLMQHDLRPKLHKPSVLSDEPDDLDMEQRRCGLQVHVDCEKLKEKWAELGSQLSDWGKVLHAAAGQLQELERALAECQLHLSSVETDLEKMPAVEKLRLDELQDARKETDSLHNRLHDIRVHIDDANHAAGKILAADSPLDSHTRNQIDAVNERFASMRGGVRVRVAALRNALADFGPSSEHLLNQSVSAPWQRAISKTNQLPYYIDHTTERTQWEHPVWVEMSKELAQFNRVKFIAYRTAMKLRALQKRLCLDLVDLQSLDKCFLRLGGLSNEESAGLEGMVSALLPLFEDLHHKHPQLVRSVPLAVDLCVNFLLNLFDPTRDGVLRVLSFKIALVAFSNGQLEEKYRYLFNLVAQEGQADQKHVALLLYDLIQIPRLVGEAAAFGGSNVEPSVRSCFDTVRLATSISVGPFLEWLKQEPQSVVWLPVMHRLAAAEFSKHQAKCNVCKMFPIVGLRYRCLRCFNLDLCQNCFFSQRTAKKHKLKHPMQEYAIPTTSGEDARDFARMMKNKFGLRKAEQAYLPVEVGDEGLPLTTAPSATQNPSTEAVHGRTAALAARLSHLAATQPAEPRDQPTVDVKSPAQLVNQVDQMQKDELDQLLQRLQLENKELRGELEKKKSQVASTPHLERSEGVSGASPRRREDGGGRGATLPRLGHTSHVVSAPSLKAAVSQNDVMEEARALRLHKQRLEHRSRILEQQNEQLELQLQRLKKVIDQQRESSGRMDTWSAEREWAEPPPRSSQPPPETWQDDDVVKTGRMQTLLATVDDLGKAMEGLVVSVVYDSEVED